MVAREYQHKRIESNIRGVSLHRIYQDATLSWVVINEHRSAPPVEYHMSHQPTVFMTLRWIIQKILNSDVLICGAQDLVLDVPG